MERSFSVTDKELLKEMENSLNKYLKAAGGLSNDAFDVLSQYNGLLWCEFESQRNILRELIEAEVDQGDGSPVSEDNHIGKNVPDAQLPEFQLSDAKIPEVQLPDEQSPEFQFPDVQLSEPQPDPEPIKQEKPNAAVGLYDKVVEFLKRQECDELPWVSVYRFKCEVEDMSDFQIKYIEYKSISEQEKNYLLFGNLTKNFSIRKINGEIVGDTSECFEYILNLGEKIGINSANMP